MCISHLAIVAVMCNSEFAVATIRVSIIAEQPKMAPHNNCSLVSMFKNYFKLMFYYLAAYYLVQLQLDSCDLLYRLHSHTKVAEEVIIHGSF